MAVSVTDSSFIFRIIFPEDTHLPVSQACWHLLFEVHYPFSAPVTPFFPQNSDSVVSWLLSLKLPSASGLSPSIPPLQSQILKQTLLWDFRYYKPQAWINRGRWTDMHGSDALVFRHQGVSPICLCYPPSNGRNTCQAVVEPNPGFL